MAFPRAAVDVDLRTGALFSWQTGRDGTTLAPRVGTTGALARATDAAAADSAGHVYTLVVNQPRWHVPDRAADPTVGLLIEPARTNLVLQSENFGTTWTATGSPTRTPAAHTLSNISLDLIGDASGAARAYYTQTGISFTGNAVKAFAVAVKQGTSASTLVRVFNATTAANVLVATVAWTGTAPNVAATTGTYLAAQPLTDGVYWLLFQTASVTAANLHTVELSPAATSTSDTASQGTVYMGGVQAENGPVPTSYLKTTTATRARAAETCVFGIEFRPQPLTITGEFSWTGATAAALAAVAAAEGDGSTHGVLALGDSNGGAGRETLTLEVLTGAGAPTARLSHLVNGAGATCDVVLTGMVPPIRYVATLADNAAVALTVTDGAGATATAQSAIPGITLGTMFYNNRLWVGAREGGTNPGVFTVRAFSVASGGIPIERQVVTGIGVVPVVFTLAGTGTRSAQAVSGSGTIALAITLTGSGTASGAEGETLYFGIAYFSSADFAGAYFT